MTQNFSVASDSALTRMPDRVTGTEWFGSSSLSLSDVIDSAETIVDAVQEPEQQGSPTAQSSSAIMERLVDTIGAISAVRQTIAEERFIVLQEWEGIVSGISEETFVASLIDMTCKDHPEEEADFPIEDLRKDDLKLLRPGAVFRWVIGYDIKRDGAKSRMSQIVFRRLPQWTKKR